MTSPAPPRGDRSLPRGGHRGCPSGRSNTGGRCRPATGSAFRTRPRPARPAMANAHEQQHSLVAPIPRTSPGVARRGDRMSTPRPQSIGSDPRSGPSFTVHVDLLDGRIRLAGLLDRGTVHLFQEAISALLLGDHDTCVVDTTGLIGCDQIGVRAIGAAYRRALRHNRRMTLTGAPPLLQQSLARLRLDHHLLDGAVGAGRSPTRCPPDVRAAATAGPRPRPAPRRSTSFAAALLTRDVPHPDRANIGSRSTRSAGSTSPAAAVGTHLSVPAGMIAGRRWCRARAHRTPHPRLPAGRHDPGHSVAVGWTLDGR